MIAPSSSDIISWATAIATLITTVSVLVRQQSTLNKADEAKSHAADAATIGVQTFHLVNGQMSSQLRTNAALANKVAALTPDDLEAKQVAADANAAVDAKNRSDEQLLKAAALDPTGAINRLTAEKKPEVK